MRRSPKIAAALSFSRPLTRRFWRPYGGPARYDGGKSAHFGSKVVIGHGTFPHFGGRGGISTKLDFPHKILGLNSNHQIVAVDEYRIRLDSNRRVSKTSTAGDVKRPSMPGTAQNFTGPLMRD